MPRMDDAARLTARRLQLAALDTTIITACERAAGKGRRGRQPPPDRAHWDAATWRRYLDEARAQEQAYGEAMRRLTADICSLENRIGRVFRRCGKRNSKDRDAGSTDRNDADRRGENSGEIKEGRVVPLLMPSAPSRVAAA